MSRGTQLRWSLRARNDLVAIARFIASDDPAAARAWVEKLRGQARRAASTPLTGRRVPEVGRDDIREVLLRHYRIVYRVEPRGIVVLTVFEGHRLFPREPLPED
ncbi:type II toxin-antitoxin system RelE/ParE family toxin [Hyalangium rubrum]|uniref:Type II toxin-antitoxin system RelE/ParE family toxin n=1 Tax=Hyalangium rubrum TaxID=3103134 RepID=A0ABU5H6J0_9BACT|nr:type II toxin-antitoxin system RelE/ParE family toxin [Hyalangium sp. s54d21]MDY7227710.1 type II toxin-antitoxin system RelE/ParE family toxin [Hyalangium sp. s54d21]